MNEKQEKITEDEIRSEIDRLAPFHHKVELPYGLSTFDPQKSRTQREYTRVDNLVKHAFPKLLDACNGSLEGKRVLDVACNCGGFSVEASKHKSEYVLGIDKVDHYIEQANFIKRALGKENIEYKVMDVEDLEESKVGLFDVTFCFGLLYHLENPVLAMRKISSVTKSIMLVDTTVIRIPRRMKEFKKQPLWLMNFPAVATEDSSLITTSRWRSEEEVVQFRPSNAAVIELLKFLGFSKVEKIKPEQEGLEKRYYAGRRTSFLAIR